MENSELLKIFFDSFSLVRPTIDNNSDSLKEKELLFSGDLSDINDWLIHEEFRLKKKNKESERMLRETNAVKAFWFSSIWAVFIAVFILLHSFEQVNYFKITSTEFMFVCGTLTTSILVFYLTVIRNLFPTQKE